MFKGKTVLIHKIAAVDSPRLPTPDASDYIPGEYNGAVSVPVDYEVMGSLASDIAIGSGVVMYRTHRNGVRAFGIWQTSSVQQIQDCGEYTELRTGNSVYRLYEMTAQLQNQDNQDN